MIVKWKVVRTKWEQASPSGLCDGAGEFELPPDSQLLSAGPVNEGGHLLISWVELTPAERVAQSFAVGRRQ